MREKGSDTLFLYCIIFNVLSPLSHSHSFSVCVCAAVGTQEALRSTSRAVTYPLYDFFFHVTTL